ncbi:hypothetical protein DFH27DRAFT_466954, partial [Peziza echinospora]
LEPLLSTFRKNHADLAQQNQSVVTLGAKMNAMVLPIEDGIRLEKEEKLAE